MAGLMEKDQVGKREDLADFVALVDVRETPFTSMVPKGEKPANTLFSWQVDKYDTHKITGTVDGSDVSEFENAAKDRSRLYNHVQVFRRTAKVSRLAEDVSTVAGVPDELARAVAKKLVEIKRDMEASFLSDNDCQADDGTVPYLTRGMAKWIQTTAQSLYPVPSAYRPASAQVNTTSTSANFAETGSNSVATLLKSVFDTTGMTGSYVLLAGSTIRSAITNMTRVTGAQSSYATGSTNITVAGVVRTFTGELADKKVTLTTTFYEGDFGSFEVVPSSFINEAGTIYPLAAYLLDMDKLHLRYNKRPQVEPLPDLGGGPRRLVEAVAGLQVDNPIGLGKLRFAS